MKAVYYETFCGPISVRTVADPVPADDGIVIGVKATGLCRSDWHGWMGHDPDIRLPNVPGHEFAGEVAAVGRGVTKWRVGDRVTVPFVCACGQCPTCASGNQQVCDHQEQPGFTHWGSFAEYVAVARADLNVVALPPSIDYVTAASLGCRFATSFRALVDQGRVSAGQWVAIHGCGGVGLSAVMIAHALGANVVAVDISDDKLRLARQLGATAVIDGSKNADVPSAVRQLTSGGAHVSIDALGSPITMYNSIACLRKRGRHVQVGLMLADQSRPSIPMDRIIAHELEIVGSHGMQAHRYDAMLGMILNGLVRPDQLVGRTLSLDEAPSALSDLNSFRGTGVAVIDRF